MGQSDCDGSRAEMQPLREQHVVVMRHGERRDNVEPLWASRASRRWDPPVTEEGKIYAFKEGRDFLKNFNFPIHRVFVSPFLRCLQTANEVIAALCAVDYDPETMFSSADVSIDPSKIKVLFLFFFFLHNRFILGFNGSIVSIHCYNIYIYAQA